MTAVAERKTNVSLLARAREALGARDLQRAISGTYHRLRLVLVVVALGLPIYLGLGGWLFWDVTLKDSLSDYYNADQSALRDVFIGSLIAALQLRVSWRGGPPPFARCDRADAPRQRPPARDRAPSPKCRRPRP